MDLRGKHALITGASSGIGRALARAVIAKGGTISAMDRTTMKEQVAGWTSYDVDITQSAQVKEAMAKIARPVDILVNNAGIMRRGTVLEISEEDYDLLMGVNLKGAWLVLKHALPLLAEGATIVQMSSRHALSLPPNPGLYGLAKRACMDFAELVAKTYPQYTVKVLCPGPVDTPLARVDVSEADWHEKRKIMCTPEAIAAHTVTLLESDTKSRLIFDSRTQTYLYE